MVVVVGMARSGLAAARLLALRGVEVFASDRAPAPELAGEFDPITPPAWGELAASTLSNATYVFVPGIGHGATPEACPTLIIMAFLANPGAPPPTGCLGGMGPPNWR